NRPDAGAEGAGVLSRRTLHRPSGSGCDVDGADHPRSGAKRRRRWVMSERALTGVPAAPGVAVGTVRVLDRGRNSDAEQGVVGDAERPDAAARAMRALAVAASEVEALAARLRGEGRGDDAD